MPWEMEESKRANHGRTRHRKSVTHEPACKRIRRLKDWAFFNLVWWSCGASRCTCNSNDDQGLLGLLQIWQNAVMKSLHFNSTIDCVQKEEFDQETCLSHLCKLLLITQQHLRPCVLNGTKQRVQKPLKLGNK